MTHWLDHSAGDLCAGMTGRLSCKIIRVIMNDDGSAHHFTDGKPVCQKQGEGGSPVFKQRRQVAGVIRMLTAAWIIVGHSVGKGIIHIAGTVRSLVNVKAKNPALARELGMGQTMELGPDEHSRICLVKPHGAGYIGIAVTARDLSHRLRPATQNGKKANSGIAAG